jgi:CheY-like chemotaxis protein
VLVADDEPPIRLLCQVNLAVAGMEVLQAEDGEEAVALARCEEPDLVLLDLMMPKWTAGRSPRTLADDERTRDIPIVFLTARATTDDRRRHELGALGYVLKPFDPCGSPRSSRSGRALRARRGGRDPPRAPRRSGRPTSVS